MRNKTVDFWKLRNEHIKNLIVLVAIILVSLMTVLASSILLLVVITIGISVVDPAIQNVRDTATSLISTPGAWNLVNEILRVLLIVVLIKLLHRVFSKSNLSLKELGIQLSFKQPLYLVIGIALMAALFSLSLLWNVGSQGVSSSLGITFSQDSLLLVILIAIANAAWQEVAFRGYLQPRLIGTYGIPVGIVSCALVFTALHGLVREISLIEIALGTVLFTLVGVSYLISKSLLLPIAIHATGNFFLRSFAANELYIPEQKYRLLVFSLALLIVMVIYWKKLFPRRIQATEG